MRYFAYLSIIPFFLFAIWFTQQLADPLVNFFGTLPSHLLYLEGSTLFSQPVAAAESASAQPVTTLPTIHLAEYGFTPIALPADNTRSSDPANPFATLRKTGNAFQEPNKPVQFEIIAHNYESITRSFTIQEQLPATLEYVADSASQHLIYDNAARSLVWQGDIAPANLDYLFSSTAVSLPYIDLANFALPNLCDTFLIAENSSCDAQSVTFNLGINNRSVSLYGVPQHQLTVTTDGAILFGDSTIAPNGHNQMLPLADDQNAIIAGLWRDVDMTVSGRWHAAILNGLVAEHDVFYAQWHDAPSADNPNLTARHAIAIVLDGAGPHDGHIFYLYDNISDPDTLVSHGYTIGIEDRIGLRGSSVAYAPCCDGASPIQGYPPASGTTLHLRPALLNADADYTHTVSYTAIVRAAVPATIVTTAYADSDSPDPHLAQSWSTHYLHVREQTFLPVITR